MGGCYSEGVNDAPSWPLSSSGLVWFFNYDVYWSILSRFVVSIVFSELIALLVVLGDIGVGVLTLGFGFCEYEDYLHDSRFR